MIEDQLLRHGVEHLYGPTEIPYDEDELIVVCVVRDGRPYVKSFVEHYLSMGVKHLVFLDNGSTDGTVEALKQYENVTVLHTGLPYQEYELLFKRYLITRFGKDRWSLCVDIDELFDYPYSDIVSLSSLLDYLNSKSYTAVMAQMLDMFSEKPLSGQASNPDEPLKELHRFYDISNIRRRSTKVSHGARLRYNTLGSDETEVFHGGIRETVFGTTPFLTKHPMIFLDGKVEPMLDSPHWVDNARIADFTCVLFHYKFLERFREQAAQAVREDRYPGLIHGSTPAQYKKYLEVLERNSSLQMKRETSKELIGVNELLEDGFLVLSENYISWVNAEEEKSVLRTQRNEARELAEAFLKSRRQEREKTLRTQRLERQLRDRDRRNRNLQEKVRHLRRQVQSLEQRLKSIEASRTWKLTKLLARIKAKVWRIRRGSS